MIITVVESGEGAVIVTMNGNTIITLGTDIETNTIMGIGIIMEVG